MDTGMATKKTNRGVLLSYVIKNKMAIKSAEMKFKKLLQSQQTNT